jgi:16S rRNA (cytosine967-C5)-methyltransferase
MTEAKTTSIRTAAAYDPVRGAATLALSEYDQSGKSLDLAIQNARELVGIDSRDNRFLLLLINGIVKMRRRLDYQIRFYLARPSEKLNVKLQNILRLGFFQLQFTDKVPHSAAVDECVKLGRYFFGDAKARMVNAVLRSYLREPHKAVFPSADDNPARYLANYYSYPDYFVNYCLKDFGEEQTVKLLQQMNQPSGLTVRVNLLKAKSEEVEAALKEAKISFSPGKYLDEFLTLDTSAIDPLRSLLDEGKIYIQDQSAGMAVRLLNPRPGVNTLDLTAAPGGKTMYCASRMRGKGKVVALDKSRKRLEILTENCKKLGVKIVSPIVCDAVQFKSEELFERVIVDPPCSGWGTAGRHADLRWSKTQEDIRQMNKIQRKLLETGAALLKPGGILVYSTCTIIRKENDQIVEEFLLRNKQYQLDSAAQFFDESVVSERGFVKTYPGFERLDGGFAARIKLKPN